MEFPLSAIFGPDVIGGNAYGLVASFLETICLGSLELVSGMTSLEVTGSNQGLYWLEYTLTSLREPGLYSSQSRPGSELP